MKLLKPNLPTENYCQVWVKTMSRSCLGHIQLISITAQPQILRTGPGADSIIAMAPTTKLF